MMDEQAPTDPRTQLERLAAALTARNYHAEVQVLAGGFPYLDVRNPAASVLTERVYAQDDSYWWSWAECISGCDQPAAAADMLARVLRTVDAD